MAGLFFSITFICGFVSGFSAFVLSPAQEHHSATRWANIGERASEMAQELREALPANMDAPMQLEPAADQAKEGGKAKQSRSELLAAASLFNAAAGSNTEEQQAVEDSLREAMSSPSRIGKPDRSIQKKSSPAACLPDFQQCPIGWNKKGVLCVATSSYSGQCGRDADLSEMGLEQKMVFARFCSVNFPCQEDCVQDFRQTCPSLWREIASNICSAPLHYEGDCTGRLDVAAMTAEDKYTWSVRCGARWACAAPRKHNYGDVCPKGWSLQFGKVCAAPQGYHGPCEHTAYMGAATEVDKKSFEATCDVTWAETGGECVQDFSAACPFGWHSDGMECLAPLTYDTCGSRKSFQGSSPAEKEDWAQNCAVRFPCQDRTI